MAKSTIPAAFILNACPGIIESPLITILDFELPAKPA
jgi:hypothetical protein